MQDEVSGHYGLGPLAMQLGHTVALAVWGNRGPTIVRIEESPNLVHVTMRHGTVMSLRNTASGRFQPVRPRRQRLGRTRV